MSPKSPIIQRSLNFTNSFANCVFSCSLHSFKLFSKKTSPGIPTICSSIKVSSKTRKLIEFGEMICSNSKPKIREASAFFT